MALCSCGDKALYQCPRCNSFYCSLSCYKIHGICSEFFYKEQVEAELKSRRVTPEDTQRTQELLKRFSESQLPCSSDEDDDDVDVARLLQNLNLKTEHELWEILTDSERDAFKRSIDTGAILELLSGKKPWWLKENAITKVSTKIKPFDQIFSKQPSDYIVFNLVYLLLSYVTCEVIFLSDPVNPEYEDTLLCLHDITSTSVITSVHALCTVFRDKFDAAKLKDNVPFLFVIENTSIIFEKGKIYIQKALSDLIKLAKDAIKRKNSKQDVDRNNLIKFKRKLEFYLSWSNSCYCLDVYYDAIPKELEMFKRFYSNDSHLQDGKSNVSQSIKLIEEL